VRKVPAGLGCLACRTQAFSEAIYLEAFQILELTVPHPTPAVHALSLGRGGELGGVRWWSRCGVLLLLLLLLRGVDEVHLDWYVRVPILLGHGRANQIPHRRVVKLIDKHRFSVRILNFLVGR